jgi:adenine-specific DNA-methyltransferase
MLDRLGLIASKRDYGTYYTPSELAKAMVRWAVRTNSDQILEPSFGEGAFVNEALDRLKTLGAKAPSEHLAGYDVDPAALGAIETLIPLAGSRFRCADFLIAEPPHNESARFDAVIGNPPYVRHHRIRRGTAGDTARFRLGLP